jgi:hypothetical protein
MSNFQKKYYFNFYDLNQNNFIVEIWQDTQSVITATQIRGDVQSFSVNYPRIQSKLTPIHNSGADINLISVGNFDFLNLYTSNMQEYQIRCYKAAQLVWCGYLNSELYTEPFDQLTNYSVNFTCNDGFSLLERLNFVDASKNQYQDIASFWTVLTNIITKLNLPYNYLYVGLSTTSNDFTIAANETLFHKLLLIQNNYYNEDGEPENCLTVLKNILLPFGAFIVQNNGSLYITDLNYISGGQIQNFQQYNAQTFAFIQNIGINTTIGDLTAIGSAGINSKLNIVPAYYKQVIKYSPYKKNPIFEEKLDDLNDLTPVNTVNYADSDTNYKWQEKYYRNNKSYTWMSNSTSGGYIVAMQGTGLKNDNQSDAYLKLGLSTNLTYWERVFNAPKLNYLIGTDKQFLKVTGKIFIRTKDRLGDSTEDTSGNIWVSNAYIKCLIKVNYSCAKQGLIGHDWTFQDPADYYKFPYPLLNQMSGSTQLTCYLGTYDNDYFNSINICDQWETIRTHHLLELPTVQWDKNSVLQNKILHGNLEFAIYENLQNSDLTGWINEDLTQQPAKMSYIKDIRVKNFKIEIVDKWGNPIQNNDVELVGNMDMSYCNTAPEVKVLQGTNTSGDVCAMGTLLFLNSIGEYQVCTTFNRNSRTNIVEKLLMSSYQSNYSGYTQEVSATLKSVPSVLGVLTSNNWLTGKKFMPVEVRHNYSESETELTIQEIRNDFVYIT